MKAESKMVCGKVAALVTTRIDLVSKSGKVIPEFEPLFTFRAQDKLALPVLRKYLVDCIENNCATEHTNLIQQDIAEFEQFAEKYPDRMKLPD